MKGTRVAPSTSKAPARFASIAGTGRPQTGRNPASPSMLITHCGCPWESTTGENERPRDQRSLLSRVIPPQRYPLFVIFLMWVAHLTYFFTYSSVGVLGPLFKQELALSNTQFGILCGAIGVGTTSAQLPAGVWCDRLGVRTMMTLSFIGIGISAFLFSFTGSLVFGCSLLFFLGLSVGCSQIAGTKAIVDWFPFGRRATAMGIKQTGVNAGGALGSLILPLTVGLYGWRFLYQSIGGLVLLFAIIFVFLYRDPPDTAKSGSHSSAGLREGILILLKERQFLFVTIIGIVLIGVQFSFSSYLVLYLSQVLHLSLAASGTILALAFTAGAAGRVGWGVASDYLFKSRELTLVVVGILGVLVCLALGLVTSSTPIWFLYVLSVLSGVTLLGWNGVWLTLVGEASQGRSSGLAIGLCFLFANLGLLFGPLLFGFLSDLFHSFFVSWMLLALGLSLVAFLMMRESMQHDIKRKEEGV